MAKVDLAERVVPVYGLAMRKKTIRDLRRRYSGVLGGMIGLVMSSAALAGDFLVDLAPENGEEAWRFRITPYVWAAGVSGEFSQFGLPVVEVNQSFSDVLENLDFGAMAGMELWRGRYGLFGDVSHVRLSGSGNVPGLLPVVVPVSATITNTTGMIAGQYRWLEGERGLVDVLGGVRGWSLKTSLSAGPPVSQSRSERASWADPVIGLKGLAWLNESFYLTGWAMVGGGVGNASSVIDVMSGVGYKINQHTALIFAYRYSAVDYHTGAFVNDSTQHGFGLGLDIRF